MSVLDVARPLAPPGDPALAFPTTGERWKLQTFLPAGEKGNCPFPECPNSVTMCCRLWNDSVSAESEDVPSERKLMFFPFSVWAASLQKSMGCESMSLSCVQSSTKAPGCHWCNKPFSFKTWCGSGGPRIWRKSETWFGICYDLSGGHPNEGTSPCHAASACKSRL